MPAVALAWIAATLGALPVLEREIRREALAIEEVASAPALARHRARLEVDGRDVAILADDGLPEEARTGLETALKRLRRVRSIRVTAAGPITMAPYVLRIDRSQEALTLAGGVPTGDLRAALLDRAEQLVRADSIEDRLKLATGAPDDFAAAATALLIAIGAAQEGEASLTERAFAIRAVASTREAYRAIRASLANMPPGYAATAIHVIPPFAPAFGWTARRDGDLLTLGGNVPSEELRARLVSRAAGSPGLRVRDEMETARGLPEGIDFAAATEAALGGLLAVQAGRAELARGRLAFSGDSPAKARLAELERRIRESAPPGVTVEEVAIRAVPASPFGFTARRDGGRVVLTGHVPDEAARRTAAAAAPARFPGERWVDDRAEADGAPVGFGEAERLALEALSSLAEGEATLRDREVSLSGRVLYPQLAARVRLTVPRSVPEGWTARVALAPVSPDGALDPIQCGDLLADLVRRTPIRFESGKAEVVAASRPAVSEASELLRRCAGVPIRVVHEVHGSDRSAAEALAAQRASALAAALHGSGANLKPEGFGLPPAAGGEQPERTRFVVEATGSVR